MAFPVPSAPTSAGPTVLPPAEPAAVRAAPRLSAVEPPAETESKPDDDDAPPPPGAPRPALKRIK
jgi:hypothetical protein